MLAARLRVALDREEFGVGAACADLLLAEVSQVTELPPDVVASMSWCLFAVGRIDEAVDLLDRAGSSPPTDVMRFAIGVELVDDPTHYRDRPAESGTPFDAMLARVDLAHGRFDRVIHLGETSAAIEVTRFGALVGSGRLDEARLHEPGRHPRGWTPIRLRSEFAAERGRPADAWALLLEGRQDLHRSEADLFRMFEFLTEARLALRYGRNTSLADAALNAVEHEPTSGRRVRIVEQLLLWRGLIALIENRRQRAVTLLREAVALMQRWDRLLFLPRAAVYLAEAEWRCGNDAAADDAAALAMRTADATGTRHELLQVLREFPEVLSRRLTVEESPHGPWRAMGRALLSGSRPAGVVDADALHVVEFGRPALRVGSRHYELPLVKCVELMAFLAGHDGHARKDAVVTALFPSRNSPSAYSYLRTTISKTRTSLGSLGDLLTSGKDEISWAGEITGDFAQFTAQAVRLATLGGDARLAEARRVLDALPPGEYLPLGRSPWVASRRREWETLVLDLRQACSEAAFDAAQYALCDEVAGEVLRDDPFREEAWQLRMRAAAAIGHGDRVIRLYRECAKVLAEIAATPAASTRRLLVNLRP
ncbi:AfsR/SARP family transcriptional regulator [Herbidospora sp. RD11066]